MFQVLEQDGVTRSYSLGGTSNNKPDKTTEGIRALHELNLIDNPANFIHFFGAYSLPFSPENLQFNPALDASKQDALEAKAEPVRSGPGGPPN